MQKQDLRNGLQTGILPFNVSVNNLSRGALTESKYTANHQKVWDTKCEMKMSSQHDRPDRVSNTGISMTRLSCEAQYENKQKKTNKQTPRANMQTLIPNSTFFQRDPATACWLLSLRVHMVRLLHVFL